MSGLHQLKTVLMLVQGLRNIWLCKITNMKCYWSPLISIQSFIWTIHQSCKWQAFNMTAPSSRVSGRGTLNAVQMRMPSLLTRRLLAIDPSWLKACTLVARSHCEWWRRRPWRVISVCRPLCVWRSAYRSRFKRRRQGDLLRTQQQQQQQQEILWSTGSTLRAHTVSST